MIDRKSFKNFLLEDGTVLPQLDLVYTFYGTLKADKSNVIWVCHALTGDTQVHDWWKGLFGDGNVMDPSKYFIICANTIGSSYGSTHPWSDETPQDLKGLNFPLITVRDMVKAHQVLAEALGIDQVYLLTGPSLGGQQALQWAVDEPDRIKNLCLVASNAVHSPWGIAFNASQRMALESDDTFVANEQGGGIKGLEAARSIALLSYRTREIYNLTQKESDSGKRDDFRASSYQRYQGKKLSKRFCAYAYYTLTKAMDSHNVGRGNGTVEKALQRVTAKTLTISVDSDLLFPVEEQAFMAQHIGGATHEVFSSAYGHDGFLVEFKKVNDTIKKWLNKEAQAVQQPLVASTKKQYK